MKHVIIFSSLLFFGAANAFSQDELAIAIVSNSIHKVSKSQKEANRFIRRQKEYTAPNYTTEQHFLTQFPDATNVRWTINGFEEASFTLHGKDMQAFYDYDNQLIGTTTPVNYIDMPAVARKYIEKHYGDYTTQKVILFDDNAYNQSDSVLYGDAFEDEDNYFIELSNNTKTILLEVNMEGLVTFYKDLTYSNVK